MLASRTPAENGQCHLQTGICHYPNWRYIYEGRLDCSTGFVNSLPNFISPLKKIAVSAIF